MFPIWVSSVTPKTYANVLAVLLIHLLHNNIIIVLHIFVGSLVLQLSQI